MVKLTLTEKPLSQLPQKYVRIVLTEDKKDQHRLVETRDGHLEYRFGAGKLNAIKPRHFITLIRNLVQSAKNHKLEQIVITLSKDRFTKLRDHGGEWFYRTVAENILLADYEFTRYKTAAKKKPSLTEVIIAAKTTKAEKTAFKQGEMVAFYVNEARDIANTPGDDLTPSVMAKMAQKLAKGTKVAVRVLDEKAIKKEGLHALWAVGKGADDMPRFIVMEYWGLGKPKTAQERKDAKLKPIILAGKGITYDTGGLNVKPSGSMHEMHMDMSGGSAVMVSIVAAAKLGLKKNIVALIPTAENAVSEKSMRAGDIINSHSGKTIEVLHTDAEGRLVLADALSYAKQYEPRVLLDIATLTGASLIALGQQASAVMTEDDELRETLCRIGEESGDYVWPLPLWDEYKTPLTQTRADVVNIHPGFSKFGGAIEGAAFLSYFAPLCPWAHLDIAPRMNSIPSDKLTKGSTGEPVRLLVRFLEQY